MDSFDYSTPRRIGKLLTIEEAGEYLNIGRDAVAYCMKNNDIHSFYYNTQLRTTKDDLDAFVQALRNDKINNKYFGPNHDTNLTSSEQPDKQGERTSPKAA